MWNMRNPNIKYSQVEVVYVRHLKHHTPKVDYGGTDNVFIGHFLISKAYRLVILGTQPPHIIVESINAIFFKLIFLRK